MTFFSNKTLNLFKSILNIHKINRYTNEVTKL